MLHCFALRSGRALRRTDLAEEGVERPEQICWPPVIGMQFERAADANEAGASRSKES
jgi:hypothetical protein